MSHASYSLFNNYTLVLNMTYSLFNNKTLVLNMNFTLKTLYIYTRTHLETLSFDLVIELEPINFK